MFGAADNALLILLNTVFGLYTIAVMLRFIIQLTQGDPYNPITQFLIHITSPPLDILRRVLPRYRNVDTASLVLMVLLSVITIELDLLLIGIEAMPGSVVQWSLLRLILLLCHLYFLTTLVEAILSWFHPGRTPGTVFLWSINEPVLRPIRRYLPPIGGVDLSPLVILIAAQVIIRLVSLRLPGVFH